MKTSKYNNQRHAYAPKTAEEFFVNGHTRSKKLIITCHGMDVLRRKVKDMIHGVITDIHGEQVGTVTGGRVHFN